MSSYDEKRALQTRQRAWEDAWIVWQRNVAQLSVAAICALAGAAPIRRHDGSYDTAGGLGRPLARRTVYNRLEEERNQYRDEYLRRPIVDAVIEEDDRLEHVAAMLMQDARNTTPEQVGVRVGILHEYRLVLESRRKLLGIDRPTKVEVTASDDRAIDADAAAAWGAASDAELEDDGTGDAAIG